MADTSSTAPAVRPTPPEARPPVNGLIRQTAAVPTLRPAVQRPEVDEAGISPSVIANAVRRCWPTALLLGLLLGPPGAVGAWMSLTPQFTAARFLRIDAATDKVVFDTADTGTDSLRTFKLFKDTQLSLISSPLVLAAAIGTEGVAELPLVIENEASLEWLEECLSARFPNDAEILNVSVKTPDPGTSLKLVDAVVDAYMSEVVLAERNRRLQGLETLERTRAETVNRVRARRSELKVLAETLGTGDPESLSIRQQAAMQEGTMLRRQLGEVKYRVLTLEGRLEMARSILSEKKAEKSDAVEGTDDSPNEAEEASQPEAIARTEADDSPVVPEGGTVDVEDATVAASTAATGPVGQPADADPITTDPGTDSYTAAEIVIPEFRIDQLVQADPTAAGLNRQRSRLENLIIRAEAKMTASAADAMLDRHRESLKEVDAELAARREELADGLRAELLAGKATPDGLPFDPMQGIKQLEMELGILAQQKKLLESDLAQFETDIKALSRSSIDVEMMREDIAAQESILAGLNTEIEKTRVELKADSRVEPITEARLVDNLDLTKRIAAAAGAGLGGLCLPLAALLLFDLRRGPVNGSQSLADRLGVPILGTTPKVKNPTVIARNEPLRSRADREMAESIDAIASMLLSQTRLDGRRVLLVTSAVPDEGKTTLACNLSAALAAAGKRVVLVDVDLRRPSVHIELGLDEAPGVSDLLDGSTEIADAVRSLSDTRDVLTTGSGEGHVMSGSTREALPRLIGELRSRYEFVILDGAPLIPIADSRVISQHADAAILTAIRDKSRVNQVVAAKELLDAYDTPVQGIVVAGCTDSACGYGDGYYYTYAYSDGGGDRISRRASAPSV
ncbi:MAG: AAA family ATPase [Planctomycetota bacterium]